MSSIANLNFFSQVDQLVAQYRSSVRKPIVATEIKKSNLNSRLTVLSELRAKLTTLKTTIDDLSKTGSESTINAYAVSSSKSEVATGTATALAGESSHALKVTQLAKNDTIVSNRLTSSATSIITSQGAGTKTFSMTINGTSTNISVDLVDGDTNSSILSKITTAINNSGAAVSASAIIDTTSTRRLMLVSKTTGSEQAISLSNVSGTLLDDLGLTSSVLTGRTQSTSTTAGYSNTSIALLNSKFNVDGIDFEKATNSVSDVLTGLTLNFSGIQTESDAPVLLTVAADKTKMKEKINKFITDYNSVMSYLKVKTSTDPTNNTRQVLAGDSTFVGLKIDLRNIISSVVPSVASGNPKMLSDLGIVIGRDGTLTLQNADILDQKLSKVTAVSDIFNSTSGVATRIQTVLKNMLSASAGQLDVSVKTTSTQITNYTDQIARFDKRLDKHVEKYRNDFLKLQAVMAQVSQQQATITSIMQSYSY